MNPGTGGWDSDTNIFTCSLNGYYMFIITLGNAGSNEENNYNCMVSLRMSDGEGSSSVVKLDYYSDYDLPKKHVMHSLRIHCITIIAVMLLLR